jgi:hypothetical protein
MKICRAFRSHHDPEIMIAQIKSSPVTRILASDWSGLAPERNVEASVAALRGTTLH